MPDQPKKKSIFEQLIDMVTLREVEKQRNAQGIVPTPPTSAPHMPPAVPRPAFGGPPPESGPPGANFRRDIHLSSPGGDRARAVEMLKKTGQPVTPATIAAMQRQLQGRQ